MRLSTAAISLAVAATAATTTVTHAFVPTTPAGASSSSRRRTANGAAAAAAASRLSVSATVDEVTTTASSTEDESSSASLDYDGVNRLAFRELQRECKSRGLAAVGSTSVLRGRLLEHFGIAQGTDVKVNGAAAEAATAEEECVPDGIVFCDEGDPDFDYKALLNEVMEKSSIGHWKAATRKLKKLLKRYETPDRPVPHDAFVSVLESCVADRLHGARAAEPARKVLEEMADRDMDVPKDLGNQCILNCLGLGPNGTHDGCGGIDCALAMLAALERSPGGPDVISVDSFGAVVSALSRDGEVDEALLLLRTMVVDRSFTPPLSTFADVAEAAAKSKQNSESVLQVMALAKAAGYELDSIASAETGRSLLASGVIAAEQMDNLALGLRLLTAASKAEGCLPDRGDDLVAASSSAAQRASTLIHRRAIDKACADDNWKLAVKLLELMPMRSLTPSNSVLRKVVAVCAKCEKSRKATALILDWVSLYEEGKAEKPPLNVFNTVVNACEICGEEELTLVVLDSMKKTHETEGNIITFNIALKRLAKLGNIRACEGIIIGMLQGGIEPTVVSYTTAIGACCKEGAKDSAFAYQWLQRMRSRNVQPNFHTYNTALAACLDGDLESTKRGSTIATEMIADVERELQVGIKGSADYKSALPDSYTKSLARQLMKQLRENWRNGDIDMAEAKATVRVPLLKLVDFDKSEAAAEIKKKQEEAKSQEKGKAVEEEEGTSVSSDDEERMEYSLLNMLHKDDHRTAEV